MVPTVELLVDDEALDLVEHRRVGLVRVHAVGAAGDDDADRRLVGLHRPDLHRRGVGAEKHPLAIGPRVEEERVVHLPRRVADGEIEGGEIVVVGLDVRPLGDLEAHVGEDRGDLVDHLGDRVDAAGLERRGPERQRDVDPLRFEPGGEFGRLEHGAPRGDRLRDAVPEAVQRRPHHLPLLGRHRAEALEEVGDGAFLAERADALGLERRLVGGRRDAGGEVVSPAPRCRSWPWCSCVHASGARVGFV